MRRLLLAAALALPLLVPLAPGRAATTCPVDLEQRNTWHRVATAGAVAADSADPCRLLLARGQDVLASTDGGATVKRVGTAPAVAARLDSIGLQPGHALLVGTDGSLWSTADSGRSWTAATGLTGPVRDVVTQAEPDGRVLALAGTQSAAPSLPVSLPATVGSSVYLSSDDGRSFSAVSGAIGLAPTAVAFDAGVPSRLWLGVSGTAGGLYVSEDSGSTFTRAAGGDVRALDSSRLSGGGSEVVAATADGLLISRDDGQTVVQHLGGTAFTDVALEWRHPSAALLLAGTVRRTSDTGAHQRGFNDGLPPGCEPRHLRRDQSIPSEFAVDCSDGSTWRLRSDGTDLSTTDQVDADAASPVPPATARVVPMRELGRRALPVPGSRSDGSIAFDGTALYYADQAARGVVHRMRASTGAPLPDIQTDVSQPAFQIAYDANRDHLLIIDVNQVVWDVAVATGQTTKLFATSGFTGPMTFDSASGHLLLASDGANSFTEYDLAGHQVGGCPPQLNDAGLVAGASMAGMVATGDGLIYAENEDDTTVMRLDRSCHVLATFSHEPFSEAPNENDALACDTTTFGTPAVWLRDAAQARVVAYSVESGYCALPSSVTVQAPPAVAMGQAGTVCATLRLTAKRTPLAGQQVDLLVAGRGIGSPRTDKAGRACTTYRPLAREAGTGTATSRARQPVIAAFLGTPAFRPATARTSVVVSRSIVVPVPPAPFAAAPAPQPVVVAPPPPPPVQPPPPPPNVPQQQPITQPQGHPGAQPGAMGQIGAAPLPEEEAQAQAQGADTHQMTAISWEAYPLPLVLALGMGLAVVRRRGASRVRGQSA